MTVKPTWMGHGLRSFTASLQEVLLPRLAGCDVLDAVAVEAALAPVPEQHAGKALIDNALCDLRAARDGVPLWRQWQGRASVPVSFTVTRDTPQRMAAEAVQCVERFGLRTLKIKGGQGLGKDLEALRALRHAVGDGVGFYVDANGAYPLAQAADYARAMHAEGASVVEDPCSFAPDAAFTALQASVDCPLLVDFPCASLRDAALFVAAGARAFSLKPGRFGLTMASALLAMAERAQALTVVGMFGESALGTWQALALASRQPTTALPAETTWYLAMREQVLHEVPAIRGGSIELQASPSVAALVDWERVRRLALAEVDGGF
jgi:L-Ala-D/L-Glu epimerase